jgi:hypothetical protein
VKNTYTITAKVTDRTVLADLLDAIEGYAVSVEISIDGTPKPIAAPKPVATPKAVKAHRSPKRSKVNETIREALQNGRGKISDLKESLTNAGMSAASLSTGIAALTKSGEIERVGDGEYALKAA